MSLNVILTGDINLMGIEDPAQPFALLERDFRAADIVFGNLECCLFDPPPRNPHNNPAFFAPPGVAGETLKRGGIQAVGIANNVNFGELPIKTSIRRLDELGILHTGAGSNLAEARAPIVLERKGMRVGFVQRTSVYWSANHEAKDDMPGVAVIRGNTSYQLPLHRETQPMNRPGVAPIVQTWTDPEYLKRFVDDVKALRGKSDAVVASVHWGLEDKVLQYMTEIAHAAIDAGADVVMGHGPHDHVLPIEVYKNRPIFYGMGALSFFTGHGGRKHGWTGLLAKLQLGKSGPDGATFQFVRQGDDTRIVPQKLADVKSVFDEMKKKSDAYRTQLTTTGDQVVVGLK